MAHKEQPLSKHFVRHLSLRAALSNAADVTLTVVVHYLAFEIIFQKIPELYSMLRGFMSAMQSMFPGLVRCQILGLSFSIHILVHATPYETALSFLSPAQALTTNLGTTRYIFCA